MGGGNHDAAVRAHGFCEVCDGGRRHGADLKHVHAHADQSACECGFEHVAGKPGIFSENDLGGIVPCAEYVSDGFSDTEGGLRSDWINISFAPDAVSSE